MFSLSELSRVFLWQEGENGGGVSKITPHRGPLTYIKQVRAPWGRRLEVLSPSDQEAELGTVAKTR